MKNFSTFFPSPRTDAPYVGFFFSIKFFWCSKELDILLLVTKMLNTANDGGPARTLIWSPVPSRTWAQIQPLKVTSVQCLPFPAVLWLFHHPDLALHQPRTHIKRKLLTDCGRFPHAQQTEQLCSSGCKSALLWIWSLIVNGRWLL